MSRSPGFDDRKDLNCDGGMDMDDVAPCLLVWEWGEECR